MKKKKLLHWMKHIVQVLLKSAYTEMCVHHPFLLIGLKVFCDLYTVGSIGQQQ